ncbi:hypothetical protein GM708_08270 [Vibrio cholerae]|nr:hypothetical protein [Vibrio cholerae]
MPAREDGTGIRTGSTAAGSTREPVTGGRRDRRRQDTAQTAVVSEEPVPSDPSIEARRIEDMDIEEALAARQAIIEDGREQAAAIAAKGDDPFTVDLGVLARQKALAERAAVLTSRARRMQELADQNQQRRPAANDPTAAHNLSIVTPPEFVRMPGSAQTVLRAPTTSHVPVVLPRSARSPITEPSTEDPEAGAPVPGAAVQDGTPGTDRIQARSAFGLEPLDAMTAGLGRLRRLRYIQYSLLGVGAAALVTGIIMTVSSLNG